MGGTYAALIVLAAIVVFILITLAKTIRVIPQARAGVVERLGRYSRTLTPGLAIVIPFVDRVRQQVDLREHGCPLHRPRPTNGCRARTLDSRREDTDLGLAYRRSRGPRRDWLLR